jgi:hypothetical protein
MDTLENGAEIRWMLCKAMLEEKWRTAVGLIMWKVNNIKYSERRKGTSYIQQNK